MIGTMFAPAHADGLGGVVSGVTGAVGSTLTGLTGAVGNAVGGGLGNTVSSTGSALGGTVGSLGNSVSNTVSAVTGSGGGTAPSGRSLQDTPKSALLSGIDARIDVLSKRELVRLCLGVGGAASCGGQREDVIRLVDARLRLLSKEELANVCVNVGADCGGKGGTKVTANMLGKNGVANARVRSNLIGGINAKAAVLSNKELARICVNAGGGSGCGTGDRSKLLGLIDTRLKLLNQASLLNLCLSVGGSCGSRVATNPGGPGNPGGPRNPDGPTSVSDSSLSGGERQAMARKCPTILRNPMSFDNDLVQLCKLARRI
ncbi:MAG: hypothetical protein ABS35_43615 [Kaistia sp. SCN 65-12]|nr:MAG: hypothetical protein ABS35_43615 [Kaistia sp. SCN 65-12]